MCEAMGNLYTSSPLYQAHPMISALEEETRTEEEQILEYQSELDLPGAANYGALRGVTGFISQNNVQEQNWMEF